MTFYSFIFEILDYNKSRYSTAKAVLQRVESMITVRDANIESMIVYGKDIYIQATESSSIPPDIYDNIRTRATTIGTIYEHEQILAIYNAMIKWNNLRFIALSSNQHENTIILFETDHLMQIASCNTLESIIVLLKNTRRMEGDRTIP